MDRKLEVKKHKKNRISQDDSRDLNDVNTCETATNGGVRDVISLDCHGDKKRKRRGEVSDIGSGFDAQNVPEVAGSVNSVHDTENGRRKKKKKMNRENSGDEEGVGEAKPWEGAMVNMDDRKEDEKRKQNGYLGNTLPTVENHEVDNKHGGRIKSEKQREKRKKSKKEKTSQEGLKETAVDEFGERSEHGRKKNKKERRSGEVKLKENADNEYCGSDNEVGKEKRKHKKEKTAQGLSLEENEDHEHGKRSNSDTKKEKKKRKKEKTAQGLSLEENEDHEHGKRSNSDTKKEKKRVKKENLPKKAYKRVTFADDVEVFPSCDEEIFPPFHDTNGVKNAVEKDKLVRGKRFSKEEDALVKEAVYKYIENHDLGEDGLDMVLHCKDHPEVKNCWKEIGDSLPWRPYLSVYSRAHIIFQRSDNRTWTPEECELIRNFHEKHGADWKTLADALGRHRVHVKDTWRRVKFSNANKGRWSQDEYQNLFDLVNMDLRMKALEEEKSDSKHGMLRDNIPWGAISDKLATRSNALCCMKWYNQLTSPMVAEGIWGDADDYRLLEALTSLDSCSMEDVDWDNLIENRSGDVCRRRWHQMVSHIGDHETRSFAEQVEILSNRYCPSLVGVREAIEEKPRAS